MKALVIDDQFSASQFLVISIERYCPAIKKIEFTNDPLEGVELLEKKTYDLLFLDIEMPTLTGFELIEKVGLENLPPIIFTTAHANYATQAFDVSAVHYLLKPIESELLIIAVKRAMERQSGESVGGIKTAMQTISSNGDKIILASGSDYFAVKFEDIIRLEGEGSYTTFHLMNEKEILTSRRLAFYAERFLEKGFVKSHQSHLVNPEHIVRYNKLNGGELFLENNQRAPVSKRMRNTVHKLLGLS